MNFFLVMNGILRSSVAMAASFDLLQQFLNGDRVNWLSQQCGHGSMLLQCGHGLSLIEFFISIQISEP